MVSVAVGAVFVVSVCMVFVLCALLFKLSVVFVLFVVLKVEEVLLRGKSVGAVLLWGGYLVIVEPGTAGVGCFRGCGKEWWSKSLQERLV